MTHFWSQLREGRGVGSSEEPYQQTILALLFLSCHFFFILMGVAGLWKELCDAGFDIPLNLLALQAFNSKQVNPDSSSRHPTRALVVGIESVQ